MVWTGDLPKNWSMRQLGDLGGRTGYRCSGQGQHGGWLVLNAG